MRAGLDMRLVLVVLVAGGCVGGRLDSNLRPSVVPKLSEMPADRERRDAVLDSSNVTTGPEQGSSAKPLTRNERRGVTAAASAAAVLGWLFSDTENVTLGGATAIDENELVAPAPPAKIKSENAKDDKTDTTSTTDQPAGDPLVPWVKLK